MLVRFVNWENSNDKPVKESVQETGVGDFMAATAESGEFAGGIQAMKAFWNALVAAGPCVGPGPGFESGPDRTVFLACNAG